MKAALSQAPGARWLPIAVGLLIAFVLMAPMIQTLIWGAALDVTPAFFLMGAGALVKVGALLFQPEGESTAVRVVRLILFWSGLAYFFVSVWVSA